MTCFGWSWEYIDEQMTLPRLRAIWKQWNRFPPLHMMVGAYFGYGKEKKAAAETNEPLDSMFASLSSNPFGD
jgi:hypothetical protein